MPASGLVTESDRNLLPIACAITAKANTLVG